MKSQKLYKPRFPWWAFDFQNERKGFWRWVLHTTYML